MLLPQRARWLSRLRSGCHERCRRWGMRQGGISLSAGVRQEEGERSGCAALQPASDTQSAATAAAGVRGWAVSEALEPLLQSSASDLRCQSEAGWLPLEMPLTAAAALITTAAMSDVWMRRVQTTSAVQQQQRVRRRGGGGGRQGRRGRCSRGAAAAVHRLSRFVSVQSRVSCPPRVSLSRPLHRSAFRQAKASLPCSAVCCSQPVRLLLSAASCRTRSLVLASADTESRAALNHEFAAAATTEPPSCGC